MNRNEEKDDEEIQNEINKEYGITDEFISNMDEMFIKAQREKAYVEGEFYEGLGKYLGIEKVYPYGKDYILKNHKFAEKPPKNGRDCAKINEILIEKIKKV